ncbi:MAG TPA: CehA/McbA family metallohydrolase, partial [Pirellulales bacterium]|nr:CehA/McbA family metallohydrolase [Pirellulales bacterium]
RHFLKQRFCNLNCFSPRLRGALHSFVSFAVAIACTPSPAFAHPHHQRPAEGDPEDEAYIHTPAGFHHAGKLAVAAGNQVGSLDVKIVDRSTGEPTFCRVNVVGADGNYYEPADHPLAPWSLHRAGNRLGKGPIRYYGWFFYTPGEFHVDVPAGPVRIEVWKGYEFRPVRFTASAAAGATKKVALELERTAPMAELGYYSGDTHLHLNRRNAKDDQRALDLIAAEDIQFGYVLAMNDPRGYSGVMERQEWPQQNGFGRNSVKSRKGYTIASGQEYRCGTYGHICLLMHDRLVLEGLTVDPNNWPVFGLVGLETRKLGGYSFHAHGGYSQEILADFAQRATDGVELLQFAEYRGIALDGWYRMLSIGYRFPAIGASDYPYCRAFGDCRTYVHSPERPDSAEWARRAAGGHSFFTTGPLLLLDVEGRSPGDSIAVEDDKPRRLTARVRVRSEVAPITSVELVVNGRVVETLAAPAGATGDWLELERALTLDESSWIAARARSSSASGQPDAEAHTNPVYVSFSGKAPYREADLDWLVARLDERIKELAARRFPEQPMALEFFNKSRRELLAIREAAGQATPKR